MTTLQRDRTIDFWNRHHEQENDDENNDGRSDGDVNGHHHAHYPNKEWIVTPSDDRLLNLLQTYLGHMNLELGCGTSQLSARLYTHTQGRRDRSFVVTDASPVCIQQNRIRDAALLSERFQYQILNAVRTEQSSSTSALSVSSLDETILEVTENSGQEEYASLPVELSSFDAILDKGCLDTFLFRSSITIREQLVDQLLTNVHGWLVDGGRYLVMSPRSRITKLRDYPGFQSVERIQLNDTNATLGALEDGTKNNNSTVSTRGKNAGLQQNSQQTAAAYLYVCTKGQRAVSDRNHDQTLALSCPTCHLMYVTFLDKQKVPDHKKQRRWKNHISHCR